MHLCLKSWITNYAVDVFANNFWPFVSYVISTGALMSFNATIINLIPVQVEKPYVKLHHTDVYYLSSLRALITIKIYKAVQSIVEDCSTHDRESVLCAFQCPLQPFNDNSKAVQVMTIALSTKPIS